VARIGFALLLLAATASAVPRHKKVRARHAVSRFLHPDAASDTPAVRYAALTPDACLAELGKREIPFAQETARGVLAPRPRAACSHRCGSRAHFTA
jgi:hypothetical protein